MKRLHSIDILRALAIVWMILIHFVDNLSYLKNRDTLLYEIIGVFGILAAPIFTFLVGISFFISLNKYPPKIARRQTLRRGAAIFLVGLLHNFIHWGTENIFDWDILTFIGSALIILYLLRNIKTEGFLAIIFGAFLLSPILREFSGYNQHWNFVLNEYTYQRTFKDIFLGWLLDGFFPLLPWIVFPLTGYLSGRAILGVSAAEKQRKPAWNLGLLGVLIALVGALGVFLNPVTNLDAYFSPILFYPASTTYLLIMLGFCLTSFVGLWLLLDAEKMSTARAKWTHGRLILPIQKFSRYSLSIYILHHSIHLIPLYLLGWLDFNDRWYYYTNALPLWAALFFWIIALFLFYYITSLWDEFEGKYSLEWFLARIVKG